MSLTIIAMTGILLGFLCLMIGFFMESAPQAPKAENEAPVKRPRVTKKRTLKKVA